MHRRDPVHFELHLEPLDEGRLARARGPCDRDDAPRPSLGNAVRDAPDVLLVKALRYANELIDLAGHAAAIETADARHAHGVEPSAELLRHRFGAARARPILLDRDGARSRRDVGIQRGAEAEQAPDVVWGDVEPLEIARAG